jgi:hypothetical protein
MHNLFSTFFGKVPEISDKNYMQSLAETLSFGNSSKINFCRSLLGTLFLVRFSNKEVLLIRV